DLGGSRARLFFRRHLAGADHVQDRFPQRPLFQYGSVVLETGKSQFGFLDFVAVACETMFLEKCEAVLDKATMRIPIRSGGSFVIFSAENTQDRQEREG